MIARADARRPLDARLRTTILAVLVSGAGLTLAGATTSGPRAALSVGIGAAVAVTNLWALARVVAALLPEGSTGAGESPSSTPGVEPAARVPASTAAWSLLAAVKMLGLFVVVWLLLRSAVASPLPMLVGFAALPVGIAFGALVSDRSALTGR